MNLVSSDPRHSRQTNHVARKASFLSIPAELRNQIYHHLFSCEYVPRKVETEISLPSLTDFGKPVLYRYKRPEPGHPAALARVCRQLYQETQLLYLGTTYYHLLGTLAHPQRFAERLARVPLEHVRAIRHIVLNAKISELRLLNASWVPFPFGHSHILLDTLTLVPHRPETYSQAYSGMADLAQCHTLALALTETLKRLTRVGTIIVRNEGCFDHDVWKTTYRSFLWRLWKWCGPLSDMRFRGNQDEQWFAIRCSPSMCSDNKSATSPNNDETDWNDIAQEIDVAGGEMLLFARPRDLRGP